MSPWVAVASFVVGGACGFAFGWAAIEEKTKKEYTDALEVHKRALDLAREIEVKQPSVVEGILNPDKAIEEMSYQDIVDSGNQYHLGARKYMDAKETEIEIFVEGGINDYGVSYIEEEEYFDDDGRNKLQIVIMPDDQNSIFTMDGAPIDDWDERVGNSILVDMEKHGHTGILYVRNHRTDEDYEVIMDMP